MTVGIFSTNLKKKVLKKVFILLNGTPLTPPKKKRFSAVFLRNTIKGTFMIFRFLVPYLVKVIIII